MKVTVTEVPKNRVYFDVKPGLKKQKKSNISKKEEASEFFYKCYRGDSVLESRWNALINENRDDIVDWLLGFVREAKIPIAWVIPNEVAQQNLSLIIKKYEDVYEKYVDFLRNDEVRMRWMGLSYVDRLQVIYKFENEFKYGNTKDIERFLLNSIKEYEAKVKPKKKYKKNTKLWGMAMINQDKWDVLIY